MRDRLTAAFVLLAILVLLAAGIVRAFVLRDLVREQESEHLQQEAALIARILNAKETSGGRVDRQLLTELVPSPSRLEYIPHHGRPLTVEGAGYDGGGGDLSSTATVYDGTVVVGHSAEVVTDVIRRDIGSAIVLLVVLSALAGLVGWLLSRMLSAPFRQLAVAAAALGRGRFDLDLPRTRIPEARAIAQALRTSAGQLEDRIRRERDFAERASHVLRTPLTGLRLELEELARHQDLPGDAQAAAGRGLASLDAMNQVAGELVELSRGGTLVAGAELSLVDLATQLAQRWADRLAERGPHADGLRGRRPGPDLHPRPGGAGAGPAARRGRPPGRRRGPHRLPRPGRRPPAGAGDLGGAGRRRAARPRPRPDPPGGGARGGGVARRPDPRRRPVADDRGALPAPLSGPEPSPRRLGPDQ